MKKENLRKIKHKRNGVNFYFHEWVISQDDLTRRLYAVVENESGEAGIISADNFRFID